MNYIREEWTHPFRLVVGSSLIYNKHKTEVTVSSRRLTSNNVKLNHFLPNILLKRIKKTPPDKGQFPSFFCFFFFFVTSYAFMFRNRLRHQRLQST